MADKDRYLHFLVVDDDEDSRSTVVEYLESLGYDRITEADNGASALKAIEKDPSINFILSDWDMPMMNGHTLLKKIRSHTSKQHIPFVIMTSPISGESDKINLAAESLVDAYLVKPFLSETFKSKIDSVLRLSAHGPQKRMVIVDDDPDALEMVKDYLEAFGFKYIDLFQDATSAMDFLTEHFDEVDLIISDWDMPKMSGIEFLKLVRAHPALSETPFLMITSQSSLEEMKVIEAAKAQVDQYLLKPFGSTEFQDRLDRVLRRARHRGDIDLLYKQGKSAFDRKQYQAAEMALDKILNIDPENDDALHLRGDVAKLISGPETALPYYQNALQANPFNASTYLKIASVYEALYQPEQAIAVLESAISKIQFNVDLHAKLGLLYYKSGLTDSALAACKTALELNPKHREAQSLLSLIQK